MMIYTDRYISKYWIQIIQEALSNLSYNDNYQTVNLFNYNKNEIYLIKGASIVQLQLNNIIKYLQKTFNNKSVFKYKNFIMNTNSEFMIPIKKNKYFDTYEYYPKSLVANVNKTVITGKFDQSFNIITIGVYNYPLMKDTIDTYTKRDYTLIEDADIKFIDPANYKRLNAERRKCVLPANKSFLLNKVNAHHDLINCLNIGGKFITQTQ